MFNVKNDAPHGMEGRPYNVMKSMSPVLLCCTSGSSREAEALHIDSRSSQALIRDIERIDSVFGG